MNGSATTLDMMERIIDSQQEACARYPNVEAMAAYMPEPFGTHHSKMMVLLRHDDLAQYDMKTLQCKRALTYEPG